MKVRSILFLLSFAALATGCIKENRDGCFVEGNARLSFHYTVAGVDKLSEHIDRIDAIFFDEQGKYLMSKNIVDRAELTLTLNPGTYYFVSWGNVGKGSEYSAFTPGVTPLADCYIEISPGPTAGDPIYYAPSKATPAPRAPDSRYGLHKLEIPAGKRVVRDVEFVNAHRTVTVYLKNASHTPDAPKVQVKRMYKRYNFLFEPQAYKEDFTHITTRGQYNGETYDVAVFYIGMGRIESDMDVEVLHGTDDRRLHKENIEEFLAAHPAQDADDIHMVIEFSDMGVNVSVPSWLEKPVKPGTQ